MLIRTPWRPATSRRAEHDVERPAFAGAQMSKQHDIQQFIDTVRRVRTPKGLEQLTSAIARDMGFDIITLFHHVDISNDSLSWDHMRRGDHVGMTTCPPSWAEHYRDRNFVKVDPRVLATRQTVSPFCTQDMGSLISITSPQRDVIESQRRFDLGDGFTIPLHFPGEPCGSFTFSVRSGRELPTQNFSMALWIGITAFQAARALVIKARNGGRAAAPARLTERQLQCTILVGRGLSEGSIAKRLGVSRETVKRHLKEGRRALGVKKSVQLVTESLHAGHITLRDLLAEKLS